MPLSSTRVIPEGWSDHHKPVTEGAMGCKIRFTRPSTEPGTFDPETGNVVPVPPTVVYDGPARVQNLRVAQNEAVTADQGVSLSEYLVVIPASAAPLRVGEDGDRGEVYEVDSNGDPQLIGRKLVIERSTFGSAIWERDLYCSEDQNRNNPGKVS